MPPGTNPKCLVNLENYSVMHQSSTKIDEYPEEDETKQQYTNSKVYAKEEKEIFFAKDPTPFNFLVSFGKLSTTDTTQTIGSLFDLHNFGSKSKEDFILKCQDKNGSIEIKHAIEASSADANLQLYRYLEKDFIPLCLHKYANFILQALIQHGGQILVSRFRELCSGKIKLLSKNLYACRVIQSLILASSDNLFEQTLMLDELWNSIYELVQDSNGNHVVQVMIEKLHPRMLSSVIDELSQNVHLFIQVENLISHKFGSRVIQKAIERYSKHPVLDVIQEDLNISPIINYCIANVNRISKCPNGNYVIQQLLEQGDDNTKVQLLKILLDSFADLSLNKFGSNVCQKSLQMPCPSYTHLIIDKLINEHDYPK